MPSKRKDRDKWEGKVYFDHKAHKKLFGTKREAAEWEVEKRRELKREAQRLEKKIQTGMVSADFCNAYLDEAQLRFVTKTYKEKKALCDSFCEDYGTMPVAAITPNDIREYLNRQAQKRSANAANKDRKNLCAMFEWGKKFCGLLVNPVIEIAKFPHDKTIQHTPSRVDVLKVLAAATPEEKVFLQVYLHTAARRSEILRLTWLDVDFNARKVRLSTRKTKDGSTKYRYITMSDELFRALQWWFKHRPIQDSPYVFPSTSKRAGHHYGQPYMERRNFLKRLCIKAKVKEFGFHAIRRHVPSYLADKGVPMKILQELLGHERLQTTEIYMATISEGLAGYVEMLSTEQEEAKQEVEEGTK